MVNRINGPCIILPIKLRIVAGKGVSPNDIPTGIVPVSSITDNAAVSITVN